MGENLGGKGVRDWGRTRDKKGLLTAGDPECREKRNRQTKRHQDPGSDSSGKIIAAKGSKKELHNRESNM